MVGQTTAAQSGVLV